MRCSHDVGRAASAVENAWVDRPGVREYWIVDPIARRIEAYALGRGGKYRRIAVRDEKIASTALPGFFLKEPWLFGPAHVTAMSALKEMRIVR